MGGGENASGGRGRSLLAAGSVLKEGECWQGFFPLLLAVAHKGVERGGGGGGGRGEGGFCVRGKGAALSVGER